MNQYLELFLTFFKIGLFTFGGGYAMIPIIENDCVSKKGWITHDEMMDMTVIAESTPGPIAINSSTYIGYRKGGMWGAIVSTIGMILPSLIIIYIISRFLDNFLEIKVIANAFKGIKIAVGVLIIGAGIKMVKKMKKDLLPMLLMISSGILLLLINLFSLNISTLVIMMAAAVISLAVYFVQRNKGGEVK